MSDRYNGDVSGVLDGGTMKMVPAKIETKAKTPSYRHAQKLAMERGDAGTYFMRKSSKRQRKSSSK